MEHSREKSPAHLTQPTLSVGVVLRLTFHMARRHALLVFGTSALLTVPMTIVTYYGAIGVWLGDIGGPLAEVYMAAVLYFLIEALVTARIYGDLAGRDEVRSPLKVVFSRLGPVLLVALQMSLRMLVGLVLLIIPGIVFAAIWFVVVPTTIVEGTRSQKAFSRSLFLTKGFRWPLIGLVMIIVVVAIAIDQLLLLSVGGDDTNVAYWSLSTISDIATNGFQAIMATVVLFLLIGIKEGVNKDQVAAVFD